MKLRTNQVLKIFALLIFTLEFLAPAFLAEINDSVRSKDIVQLADGSHQQNLLCLIISEEATENEEGREGHREAILIGDIYFTSSALHSLESLSPQKKYSSIISEQFDTHPELFKLNCTFLV